MSQTVGIEEKAHYFLKDALGRDPTWEEVQKFLETFKLVEVWVRK